MHFLRCRVLLPLLTLGLMGLASVTGIQASDNRAVAISVERMGDSIRIDWESQAVRLTNGTIDWVTPDYLLQASDNLLDWVAVGEPIRGNIGQILKDQSILLEAQDRHRFFRLLEDVKAVEARHSRVSRFRGSGIARSSLPPVPESAPGPEVPALPDLIHPVTFSISVDDGTSVTRRVFNVPATPTIVGGQ